MYIAKKETNGFTIFLMTDRGDTYQWNGKTYETMEIVQDVIDALNNSLTS